MKDIRAKNYNVFWHIQNPRLRNNYIKSLIYIDRLASQTKTDIDDWDIFKLFACDNEGKIQTDKIKINQIFFSQEIKKTQIEFDPSVMAYIQKYSDDYVKRQTDKILNELERKRFRLDVMLDDAGHVRGEIESLCSAMANIKDTNYLVHLDKIYKEDVFNISVINDELIFKYKRPLIISYTNKAEAVDIDLSLRHPSIGVCIRTFRFSFIPDERYARLDYPHPHVNRGNICFGNKSKDINEACTNRDLYKIISITDSVLRSYNSENPYTKIHTLKERISVIEKTYGNDVDPNEQQMEAYEASNTQANMAQTNEVHQQNQQGDLGDGGPPL